MNVSEVWNDPRVPDEVKRFWTIIRDEHGLPQDEGQPIMKVDGFRLLSELSSCLSDADARDRTRKDRAGAYSLFCAAIATTP